jgi:hypothetical protein
MSLLLCVLYRSNAIDEDEFLELIRTVNNAAPLFPGNFTRALEEFDVNNDGKSVKKPTDCKHVHTLHCSQRPACSSPVQYAVYVSVSMHALIHRS